MFFAVKSFKSFFIFCFLLIPIIGIKAQLLERDLRYHPDFDSSKVPFFHGVASGDATDSSVVIWTRVTPKFKLKKIKVKWFVASDTNLKQIIDSGFVYTFPETDYTVKIQVKGLKSYRFYYYGFFALGNFSDVGRLKTLPSAADSVGKISFAVFTGSNYRTGYYNVYREVCKRNFDFLVHTGDYIYEYGDSVWETESVREVFPPYEVVSKNDYEKRYSHYRLDKDLQEAHRLFTWYVIWDDHESANNSWVGGAQNHQPAGEGKWQERKHSAMKVYDEWMPVILNDTNVYRSFCVGNLFKMIFLDTRLEGRDNEHIKLTDTTKKLLSNRQWNWLFSQFKTSKNYNWIFLVQQVMLAPLTMGKKIMNTDQWDGYPYERSRLLRFVSDNHINNMIVISGDIHSSWANEIYYKNKKVPLSVEFITPSVSSPSVSNLKATLAVPVIKFYDPHVKYVNLKLRGFMKIEVSPGKVRSFWYLINTVKKKKYTIRRSKCLQVRQGDFKLKRCNKH